MVDVAELSQETIILIFTGIAAVLTTLCMLPQALQILRSKHAKDISLWMYVLLTIGLLCWLVVGYLYNNPIMMLSDLIALILALAIIRLKLKYG